MTDEITKEVEKLQAFIEPPAVIAGVELRPFTAGSLMLLEKTGNKLHVSGKDAPIFDVLAYIYMHSAPIREVQRAAVSNPSWTEAVELFSFGISIQNLLETAGTIGDIIQKSTVGIDYQVQDRGSENPNSAARRGSPVTS
jgi:hypothetical protein